MRKEKDNGNQSGVIQNRKIWHCTAIRFMHGLLNLTPSRYFQFSLLPPSLLMSAQRLLNGDFSSLTRSCCICLYCLPLTFVFVFRGFRSRQLRMRQRKTGKIDLCGLVIFNNNTTIHHDEVGVHSRCHTIVLFYLRNTSQALFATVNYGRKK
jgi:hypothetical protein